MNVGIVDLVAVLHIFSTVACLVKVVLVAALLTEWAVISLGISNFWILYATISAGFNGFADWQF